MSAHVVRTLFRAVGAAAVICAGAACAREVTTGPSRINTGPPFIGVLPNLVAPPGAFVGDRWTFRFLSLTDNTPFDSTIAVTPGDTVIVSVPPATYAVQLRGVPPTCALRRPGTDQAVIVPEGINTAIVRYSIECQNSLVLSVDASGADLDGEYIYSIRNSGGSIVRSGFLRNTDTLRFGELAPGPYEVRLDDLAPNCVAVNDGGVLQPVMVDSTGNARLIFRVSCSDPVRRPVATRLRTSFRNGVSAFMATLTVPDRNLDRYYWDITDCRARSRIGGERLRTGLRSGDTRNRDTVIVFATYEIALPPDSAVGACTSLRFEDSFGNTTPRLEVPFGQPIPGQPPTIRVFNASALSTGVIQSGLLAADPNNDILGVFAAIRLRDGGLGGRPDGSPDYGIFSPSGYLGTVLPDVRFGPGALNLDLVEAVIVYVFDAEGNYARQEDANLRQ